MLVLSRKRGERVVIGGAVVVTVVDVRGDRVRLGFEAPESITVLREELCHRDEGARTQDKEVTGPHESPFFPEFA
jgi:carbon storage regulator